MTNTKKKKQSTDFYSTDLQYLEDLFRLMDMVSEKKRGREEDAEKDKDKDKSRRLEEQIRKQQETIRKRKKSGFALDKLVSEYKLHSVEKKILLFLLYRYFSGDREQCTGRSILEHAARGRVDLMRFHHYLLEDGRLRSNKLVTCCDSFDERSVLDIEFSIPQDIVCKLLGEEKSCCELKPVEENSYKRYLNMWFSLIALLEQKEEIVSLMRRSKKELDWWGEVTHSTQKLGMIRHNIRKTEKYIESMEKQPHYPLEEVVKEYQLNRDEKLILAVLLRDSLGLSEEYMGYEGKRLLALISESEQEMIAKRALLYQNGKLRTNKLIRTGNSWAGQNILEAEYYLSEKMIRRLLGHNWQENNLFDEELQEQDDDNVFFTIAPRFGFADVILSEQKKKYIEIALSQQVHRELIFDTWGFGKNIPYGNALTMLFSGPPGTGKTMMAEAVAHYLDKKLLVANYSQIQNLYVGETEKRIVNVFKKARQEQGVLLWDEADSMFYSRDMARSSWEHRDVNVILQELEKFSGVVILTTNRKITLDVALERRLAVKMDFEMPGAKEREAIWRKLVPVDAPMANDVDFKELADKYPVSGGLIKNAVLHAARYAAYRQSPNITMEDFVKGIKMEVEHTWNENGPKIGFTTA